MYWRLRTIKYHIRHLIRWPKYATQRIRRGFSSKDMWNADAFLARMYADILMWYVHNSVSVPSTYLDTWSDPVEVAVKRRDADYIKYADIFRRYGNGGSWDTQEHADDFNGVLDTEMAEALESLSKHFQEFWD